MPVNPNKPTNAEWLILHNIEIYHLYPYVVSSTPPYHDQPGQDKYEIRYGTKNVYVILDHFIMKWLWTDPDEIINPSMDYIIRQWLWQPKSNQNDFEYHTPDNNGYIHIS